MSSIIDLEPEIGASAKEPQIPIEEIPENLRGRTLSPEELKNLAYIMKEHIAKDATVQLVQKRAVPVSDFSKLTQDAIYDPDIFMEAKPFMSGDPLKVTLKDTNYEPRWVSKNSQRLGHMKVIGFTYVTAVDIEGALDIDLEPDAHGHFSFGDVVLMRVPKASYYPALRAAAERAKSTINHQQASKNGTAQAVDFMRNSKDDSGASISGDYAEASQTGKLQFYQPGV